MTDFKQDRIALDRSVSARTVDAAGHMRVVGSTLSLANVCPYKGSEIPDYEKLGLDPNKIYQLYRDPDSLEKAVAGGNGKPLTLVHRPQTAADHDHEIVVGSIDNLKWVNPALVGDLSIWSKDGIDVVESGEQKDLSLGYYYVPVMEGGTAPDGTRFDGRMTSIAINHCTLVPEGRVKGAFVGDSAPPAKSTPTTSSRGAEMQFNTKKLSRPALLVGTALHTRLLPKMAADAKFDLTPIVAKVTKKTWKADAPKLKAALDKGLAGKLAADADLEDVADIIEAIAPLVEAMPDEAVGAVEDDEVDDLSMDDDAEGEQRLRAHLKSKGMADPDIEAACAAMKGASAMDAPPPDAPKPGEEKDTVTKSAMDAALAEQATQIRRNMLTEQKSLREAEEIVRPVIGAVIAQDSADAVYRLLFASEGIDVEGVPATAYKAIAQQAVRAATHKPAPRVAMDASGDADFEKRFPGASRIRSI